MPTNRSTRGRIVILLATLLLVLAGAFPKSVDLGTGSPSAGSQSHASSQTAGSIGSVAESAMPAEARHTLALIDSGGPFPYDEDGEVFQNREGALPDRQLGYYHEYTVATPGAETRGTRRLVTGQNGTAYYTDDHYQSFRAVQRGK